jgi:DNA-binding transcriptional MocR family regulator
MSPETIANLTAPARNYAKQRAILAERVQRLEDEIAAVRRRLLPGIKTAAVAAGDARGELESALRFHKAEFDPPAKRTVAIEGVKIGFEQSKPAVLIADEQKTVDLIRKHLPDQAETLIAEKRTVVKAALRQLGAAELRRIGAFLTPADDLVVIKSTTDQIDKIVDALLKTAADASSAASAA